MLYDYDNLHCEQNLSIITEAVGHFWQKHSPGNCAPFSLTNLSYRYCRMLEEGSFRGRTADFVFMFIFGGVLMTVSFLGKTIIISTNWVAPCKPAPRDYFVAIFQVAQNQLQFGMSTLFVLKNVPVFFFQECRKIWTKLHQIQPSPLPLCPSPNNVEIWSLRAKTLCVCVCVCVCVSFMLLEGDEGGGGELSRMCLKPCFPACEKKRHRDISFGHFLKIATK